MVPSVQNPSIGYQVEQLHITCSQTLVNMTIIQTIQRSFFETYAQQYQSFLNGSVSVSYSQSPTQLTYAWNSLPGTLTLKGRFPHFIQAEYFYIPGSVRNTGSDTWEIWLQTICGEMRYYSGIF